MIMRPSGDQTGFWQPIEVGLERGPPQPGTGILRNPLPSEWTTQIVLRSVSGTLAEKTISFPCGDQLPLQKSTSTPSGVILCSPLPFDSTTDSCPLLTSSRRLFGEWSAGQSSN